MYHLLLEGYKDIPSFLNHWELKKSLVLFLKVYFFKQARCIKLMIKTRRCSDSASYGIIFRILLVKTLVPERCAIFCWQVMKMFHLFLTSGSLKGVLYYSLKIYFTKQVPHLINDKGKAMQL